LTDEETARYQKELDQYVKNVELESIRKQTEERRIAKQKLEDEERERQEAIERAEEDAMIAKTLATIEKEKRSEAGKKGWQTQLRNGRVTASMLKAEAKAASDKRLQQRLRSSAKSERGVRDSRSSTDATRRDRLRQLGYEGLAAPLEALEAGPSRSKKSARSDRSRREERLENAIQGRSRSDIKPLKRTRSFISDDGEIILPFRANRDTSPSRLVSDSHSIRPSDRRPRYRDDRRLGIPRHPRHERGLPPRPRSGLRRTDHPGDYGLPVSRYPREQDHDREQRGRPGDHWNRHRIERPQARSLQRPIRREADNRERDERETLAGRVRDRDQQTRQEERERIKRREAREKLEREETERRDEEEERNLGPMEEQVRAFEEREYQRSVKREQLGRKEERRRARRLEGTQRHPISVPDREVKREREGVRRVDRGSRLSVRGAVIDMTELSD